MASETRQTPSGRTHGRLAHPVPETWLLPETAVVRHQNLLAEDLVRLRVAGLEEILVELDVLCDMLRHGHPERVRAAFEAARRCAACVSTTARLQQDHQRFQTSAEQLYWFWAIVKTDDHGGNRQALGQYWKVVLEALATHLKEEVPIGAHDPVRGKAAST